MLEIINVHKWFIKKKGINTKVLTNLSLKLPNKGLVFILGKSGSGKSTLLNLLGGLDKYNSGDILINKISTKQLKQNELDNYRNGVVGFIFQEFNLIESMNVYENIALANELQGQKPDNKIIYQLLKELELLGYEKRKINELSGGQKQRIAIARALIKNPKIILADEPTGNLDFKTGEQIFNILKKMSKDKLVLVVSHDVQSAFKYGDRVIQLKDGQILEDLTKEHNLYKFKKHQFTKGQILNDEIIQKIQDQFKNIHREGFLPTQEILLDEQPLNVKYISSQLSLKQTFKMGASAFKNKKVLLFFSTLIVSWASAIFSVVLEAFIYAKELAWKFFLNSSLSSIKNYNSQLKPDWLKTYTELKRIEFEQNYVFIIKKFFYVRILLIVFLIIMSLISFMMIYMYFSASIKLKKKEIGSLRALGASGLTVSKIFLSEGFIYATLVNILIFVFSSLGGFATGLSKMTTIRYWFFLGAEYLFVYVLSFLSIALPIYKLSHQKPIDVISNQ